MKLNNSLRKTSFYLFFLLLLGLSVLYLLNDEKTTVVISQNPKNPKQETKEFPPTKKHLSTKETNPFQTMKTGTNIQTYTDFSQIEKKRLQYESFLQTHPYKKYLKMSRSEREAIPKQDRPDLAMMQEFFKTLDPALGYVPYERMELVRQKMKESFARKAAIPNVSWIERGPNNVGGRTRALLFDPNDATRRKVWAGGVSGGLWFNNDITSGSSTWSKVDDFFENLAITTIAADPNNSQTFYVGTGEGWLNADAIRGGGIWKSTNGGMTWTRLNSTIPNNNMGADAVLQSFTNIQKIVVNSSGHIFAATRSIFTNRGGILKSTDGGTSWTRVLAPRTPIGGIDLSANNSFRDWAADLEIGSNGILYASFGISSEGRIFRSTDATGTSWVDISPNTLPQRIELAVAPSSSGSVASTVIYAIAKKASFTGNEDIEYFKKSTNGGGTWTDITIPKYRNQTSCNLEMTIPFTRGQAFYDLILAVHPSDPNLVIAGGVDVHRSTNGGTVWTDLSYWTGGCSKPFVHADQHIILFRPNNSNEILIGNDGGVFYSSNAGNSATASPTFAARNSSYNVTQFYSCAGKNDVIGSNFFLGGSQDNGTQRINTAGVSASTEVTGGDGGFCFVDQDNPNIQISSFVRNTFYLLNGSGNFIDELIEDDNTGNFINSADYDDAGNTLYTYKDQSTLYRVRNVSSGNNLTSMGIGTDVGADISAIQVGKAANTVFVGTEGGRVYKLTNTDLLTATATRIDNSLTSPLTTVGSISCIEIGATDNELLVTFSNFGVTSVWYTNNGGTSWISKDEASHGLPDMPIRWALFNPEDTKQVLLATESGVWSSNDVKAANPGWGPSNLGLANVRCDMLQFRSIDEFVILATHGRGLYTSNVFSPFGATALEDNKLSETLVTYPNPSTGSFKLKSPENLYIKKIKIFDLNGTLLYKENIERQGNEFEFQIPQTSKGLYFLKLETNLGDAVKKILRE